MTVKDPAEGEGGEEEVGAPGAGPGPAPGQGDAWHVVDQRRDQMLKLVTRGFFNELVNYGVKKEEILHVASLLLDNVLVQLGTVPESSPSSTRLTVRSVRDRWKEEKTLTVDQVTLRPLERALLPRLAEWLRAPAVNESFVPPFPTSDEALARHFFETTARVYLTIHVAGEAVGIIGGENLDAAAGRIEMRKLVGDPALRSQGIGKRTTFAFLYFAFSVLGLHKVYIHSRDVNVRNINLNSRFGFELEGVFLEEIATSDGRRADVVRMALLKPLWLALFGDPV